MVFQYSVVIVTWSSGSGSQDSKIRGGAGSEKLKKKKSIRVTEDSKLAPLKGRSHRIGFIMLILIYKGEADESTDLEPWIPLRRGGRHQALALFRHRQHNLIPGLSEALKHHYRVLRTSAVDPDPDPDWIRIQGGQKWSTKIEKSLKFHFFKCWIFSFEGWRLL